MDRLVAISGVCPVVEVPFDSAGEIAYYDLERLSEYLFSLDVGGVMFPGYASEMLKLGVDETATAEDCLLRYGRTYNKPVVLSVFDHGRLTAVRNSVAKVERGANAINILPPYQLSPSLRQVEDHILAVAEAVFPTPVILQYAPDQTGTVLTSDEIRGLALETSNIRQIKVESSPPSRLISELASGEPAITVGIGYGGLHMVDAMRRGAVCVQPGCSFVEVYLAIWSAWCRGEQDLARRLHTRLLPYISYWMTNVELIVAAEKYISVERGLISTPVCRYPRWDLDKFELASIEQFLGDFRDLLHR